MAFFKKKRKALPLNEAKIDEVFVITSRIVSSHDSPDGPMCVYFYLLARQIDNTYYELFSGKKLEDEPDIQDACMFLEFDTPYVEKVEPLRNFLKTNHNIWAQYKVWVSFEFLFDFIANINVLNILDALPDDF